MPQFLEDNSGWTAYQPSVRILKRDRTAETTSLANQLVFVQSVSVLSTLGFITFCHELITVMMKQLFDYIKSAV